MQLQKPCFWYLGCSVVFAPLAFFSWYRVPAMMEQFRPANGGLLDGMMLGIKLSSGAPALVLVGLLCLFLFSCLRGEVRSSLAVKTVSLCLIAFLVFTCIDLYMALFVVAYCGVLPHQ